MKQIDPDNPPSEYRQVLDALRDPIIASNESGMIVYVNGGAERLLGWRAGEIVGRPLTIIMPPRFRAAHESGFRRFMRTHRPRILGQPIRVPALDRDGFEIDVELTLSEVRSSPHFTLVIAVLRDLRQRVALEQVVASQRKILAQHAAAGVLADATASEETLPKFLELTAAALGWDVAVFWRLDPALERLRLSATWSSSHSAAETFIAGCEGLTFGRNEGLPGEVLAQGRPLWSPDVRADDRYVRARLAARHGLRTALLLPVYCASRTWGVLEYLAQRQEDPDEELIQTMASIGFQLGQFLERMSTERRLREALAQAQADRDNLHRLFMQAPAAIAIVRGPDLRYELSNPMNQVFAGGRPLLGTTVQEALPEHEGQVRTAVIRRVYETGEPFVANELPVTLPAHGESAARQAYLSGVVQPLRDGGGKVDGAMVLAFEVTDLVLSRERAREAEERLRLAIDAASLGIFDFDPANGAIRCDERYKALFGIPKEAEVTTDILTAAIHPEDLPRVRGAVAKAMDPANREDFVIDYRIRGLSDGVERWGHMRGRTLFDDAGRPQRFIGTGVDVTEQRRAVERLKFLADTGSLLAGSLDYRATLHGVAQLAVPILADWCVVEIANEDGSTEQVAAAHRDPAKVHLARELRIRYPPRPDSPSGVARVMATGQPLFTPEVSDEMLVTAAHDEQHLGVLRALGLKSSMLLPLLVRGKPIGVLALIQAESGRRYTREDLAFAEEVARRASLAIDNARLYRNAIEAISIRDEFLSIASHELRTPLTTLTLQLSTLERLLRSGRLESTPREKLEHRLRVMNGQAFRLGQLIEELLDVSRISTGRLELEVADTDLMAVVRSVLASMSEVAALKGTSLELSGPGKLEGRWDRHRLEQVVVNLVENALKYGGGNAVRLSMEAAGESAVLRVRDEGPGISEGDQGRIFEQFERAASPNLGGLGLGLWIVRKVVEAHCGVVRVESRLGAGSTFVIELPLAGPRT